MQESCVRRPKTYNTLRVAVKIRLEDRNEKITLKILLLSLKSCDHFNTEICNCFSLIFKKNEVACTTGLKTNNHWEKPWK